jgi:hypothetical protein
LLSLSAPDEFRVEHTSTDEYGTECLDVEQTNWPGHEELTDDDPAPHRRPYLSYSDLGIGSTIEH